MSGSKVTAKLKWNGNNGACTLRLSGPWLKILCSLHEVGQAIAAQAKERGYVRADTKQPLPGLPAGNDHGIVEDVATESPTEEEIK